MRQSIYYATCGSGSEMWDAIRDVRWVCGMDEVSMDEMNK